MVKGTIPSFTRAKEGSGTKQVFEYLSGQCFNFPAHPSVQLETISCYPAPWKVTQEWPKGEAKAHIGKLASTNQEVLKTLGKNGSPSPEAQDRTKAPL